jgi:hypothetical protein
MPSQTQFSVANTTAVLTRTPAALDALLRDLPDLWGSATKAPTPGAPSMWLAT